MAKTLLVADDSATMRRVVEMTFAGEDVQVVSAPSGEAALQKARDVKPDVVLADAQMGAMSGYELCRAIKADGALRGVPVIVMASQHAPYDESLGRDVGADDHCIKPFDTQALIDKVKAAVARGAVVSAAAPTAKMPAAPAGMPAAATVSAAVPSSASVLTPPPSAAPQPAVRPSASPTLKTPAAPPPPAPHAPPPRPAPVAAAPPPAPPPPPAHEPAGMLAEAADAAVSHAMGKAGALGLTPEQASAVAKLTREVVERIVWEVVPDLAETIIREEIRRLTRA